ncbi:hypothetical protein ACJ41O_005991 [Fusarium nematophilum]
MSRPTTFSNTIHLRDFVDSITADPSRENASNYVKIQTDINIFKEDGFYGSRIDIDAIHTRIRAYLTREERELYTPNTFFYADGRFSTTQSLGGVLQVTVQALSLMSCTLTNYSGPDTTQKGLMNAISEVFQELLDDPMILPDWYQAEPWFQPGHITLYQQLKSTILSLVYSPSSFLDATGVITNALDRNWTPWFDREGAEGVPAPPPGWSLGTDAFHGIACSDSTFRAGSQEDLYSLAQAQSAQGSFSDAFSAKAWVCAQWRFEAAERYKGDFREVNTSFPVMFANSRYDPITPLSGAWDAASRFKGSRLLVHEGHGHGVKNHLSNCISEAIGNNFANGTLPELGTVCKPNMNSFAQLEAEQAAAGRSDA